MEIILAICTILGTIIAVHQYQQSKAEVPDAKETLLAQFTVSRKLIDSIIDELTNYAIQNNAYSDLFVNGTTFKGYIAYLKDMRDKELSNNMYDELKKLKLNKSNIEAMLSGLEKQILSFNNTQAYFYTAFKYR